jgi:hypothetical protein
LPTLRNLPVQFRGSQASILISLLGEVLTVRAIRHMSAVTTCHAAPQDASRPSMVKFVPEVTYSENQTVVFSNCRSEAMVEHVESKGVVTPVVYGAKVSQAVQPMRENMACQRDLSHCLGKG